MLIEGQSRGKWYGRTRSNKLVHIASEEALAGQLVIAHVTHTSPWSLQGELRRIIPTLPQPVDRRAGRRSSDDDCSSAAPTTQSGELAHLPPDGCDLTGCR